MFEESASAIPSSIWASMNSWFTPTVLFVVLNLMIGTIAFTSSLANQKPRHQNQTQMQSQNQNEPHHQKIDKSPSVLQRLKSINFYAHYRSQEPQDSTSSNSVTLSNLDSTNLQAQAPEIQTHYLFQENNEVSQSRAPYIFEQTHEHNPQETQSHYIFEQTHEHNSQENQTHFVFEGKDSYLNDFKQAHEEKVEDSELQSMDEVYSQLTGSHFNRTKSETEPASGEVPTKLPAKMKKSASSKSAFGHFEEKDIVEARRPETVRERGGAKLTEADEEVDSKADDFIHRFKQQLKLQRLDSIIRYKDMIGRSSGGRS